MKLVREEVPQLVMNIAAKRTCPHLEHMRFVDYDLKQLVANCYMQGVHDTAEAVVSQARRWSDEDYQI